MPGKASERQAGSFMKGRVEENISQDVSEIRLSIEVTTHCNCACSHCFARAGIFRPSSLPLNLVKAIIAEGYKTGYRHFHITGGEPMLWEGLFETLDYSFSLGYETVFLNTNGTLLTKEVCKRLSAYEGLSISVSLQGSEKLHDRVRGKGLYRKTEHCIDIVLNASIDLYIFTTALKSLLPDLPHFADEIYKRFPDIKHLTIIQPIRVSDDIFDMSYELLDPNDFLQLVRTVSFLNLYGLKTDVLNNPLASVASKLLRMPWIPQTHPMKRSGRIVIMADRNIAISHDTRDFFGKYKVGMIEKVLSSDEYRNATASDDLTCPTCRYTELCKENDMIRPSEWFWDMNHEIHYCKRVLDRALQ